MKDYLSKFFFLWLLAIILITSVLKIQPVRSDWMWTETIYIREDGSVFPSTVPISTVDNITYTLMDNIVGNVSRDASLIIIRRDNIILDGQGYSLQGTKPDVFSEWGFVGLRLCAENVTIRNLKITKFHIGINLHNSSYTTISGNQIIDNYGYGITFENSSFCTISDNLSAAVTCLMVLC